MLSPLSLRALLLPLAFVGSAGVAHAARAGEPPQAAYDDEITVALDTLTVRVVDAGGQPILGLAPADFLVRVHGKEIPVTAVDWVSGAPAPRGEEAVTSGGAVDLPDERPAGKLVVFFVQADLEPTRISGQLRLRPYTRELLATLAPDDRVAVVSFDSHLKLWLDFSADRDAAWAALDRAMLYTPEEEVAPSRPPSLAAGFDLAAARLAASPEKALEVTARALIPIPGEKTMVFLGWGLGRFGGDGVRTTPAYPRAVKALSRARVSVFVLDVTSADSHSLEVGLQGLAAATGGTYASTFRLPALAVGRLARAISGWYVLTIDRDALEGMKPGEAIIHVRGRRNEILSRPVEVR